MDRDITEALPPAAAGGAIQRRGALQLGLSAAACLGLGAGLARAQAAWPNRPVKIIVPLPAGGSTEPVFRQMAARIEPELGQPVVFEYRPGATMQLGTSLVAKAPPDGYTLLVTADPPFSILPWLNASLPYNPEKDFAPLSMLCQLPVFLVTQTGFPANSVREFIAHVRANPGRVSYSTAGVGSQAHVALEMLSKRMGLQLLHVPYQGIAPAFNALLAGDVNFMLAALGLPLPHIRLGKLKTLAVASPARHPLMPDIPTFAEAGVPDFQVTAWFGAFAPAGISPEIRRRLATLIWAAVSSRDYINTVLSPAVFDPASVPPERFPAFLREDSLRWKEAVAQVDPAKLRP